MWSCEYSLDLLHRENEGNDKVCAIQEETWKLYSYRLCNGGSFTTRDKVHVRFLKPIFHKLWDVEEEETVIKKMFEKAITNIDFEPTIMS
jgi:hypothetical protein